MDCTLDEMLGLIEEIRLKDNKVFMDIKSKRYIKATFFYNLLI